MKEKLRVLFLEDCDNDVSLLVHELQRGYEITFRQAVEPEAFKSALKTAEWDLIIADYSVPHFHVLDALACYHYVGLDIPFIVVSGAVGEEMAVDAMRAGAHDYIRKENLSRLLPAIERERREASIRVERRKAVEELRRQRDRVQQYLDVAGVILLALNEDGRITLINRKGCRILECNEADALGKSWFDEFIPSEERAPLIQQFQKLMQGEIEITEYLENTILSRSGKRRTVAWRNAVIRNAKGAIVGSISSGEDVTESRKTDERLAYQAHLLANINDTVIATDENIVLTAWNRAAEAMYGWREEEVLGKRLDDVISRDLADVLRSKLAAPGGPDRYRWEMVHYHRSGQPMQVEGTSIRLSGRNGSQITGYVNVHRDITARVQAEEVLCRSEERFFKVFRSSPAAIAIETATDGRIVEVNDRFVEFSGYRREELVGRHVQDLHLWADQENREHILRRIKNNGTVRNLESRFQIKSGEIRLALVSLEMIQLPNEPIFISMLSDITDRKRAEEALRYSEELNRRILETVPGGIVTVSKDGNVLQSNEEARTFLGMDEPELTGSHVRTFDPKTYFEDGTPCPVTEYPVFKCLQSGQPQPRVTIGVLHPRGYINWGIFTATPLIHPQTGEPEGAVVTFLDITQRKQAEEALRFTKFSVDTAADAIFWIGSDAHFLYANESALKLLGYSAETLLSMTVYDIDPNFPKENWDQAWRDLKERRSFTFETLLKTSDGSTRPIELTVNFLEFKGKEYNVAFARDVTERKRAEEELRRTTERMQALSHRLLEIQEQERRHLARELHDEIGQALTAAKINLQAIQRFPDPAVLTQRLDDSVQTIDRLLNQVRQMSLNLRPPLLDDLGLVVALKWYTNQQAQRAGFRLELAADSTIPRLDPAIETACFRVAQEAITNVIRHAQAQEVTVELYQQNNLLHLVVRDDGKGFDMQTTQKRVAQGASLGWTSMQERVSLAGGQLDCQSSPESGTVIHACFPLTPRTEGADTEEVAS